MILNPVIVNFTDEIFNYIYNFLWNSEIFNWDPKMEDLGE